MELTKDEQTSPKVEKPKEPENHMQMMMEHYEELDRKSQALYEEYK